VMRVKGTSAALTDELLKRLVSLIHTRPREVDEETVAQGFIVALRAVECQMCMDDWTPNRKARSRWATSVARLW
jgi:hypothetical protein